jgi:hypothetical protein
VADETHKHKSQAHPETLRVPSALMNVFIYFLVPALIDLFCGISNCSKYTTLHHSYLKPSYQEEREREINYQVSLFSSCAMFFFVSYAVN